MTMPLLLAVGFLVAQAFQNVSAPSCDDACVRQRATFAAGEWQHAAQAATLLVVQNCYGAWAAFDTKVAQVGAGGDHGRSPQFSAVCHDAAVAVTGNANATGSVNTAQAAAPDQETAQLQGQAMGAVVGAAADALGGTLDVAGMGQLGSMLGGLFGGGGSPDDRPAFDQATFDGISQSADAIFAKLEPAITYNYLTGVQRSIPLPPEDPNGPAHAPPPSQPARVASSGSVVARAENGEAEAQYILGTQYLLGNSREKDPVLAYKWLRLAALGGDDDATTLADKVFIQLSAAQRAAAKALIDEYRSDHRSPG